MEAFEIKELLTVKGKSGLWRLVKIIPGARMARIKNLVSETETTVKVSELIALKQYKVFTKAGEGERSLEEVFENIMTVELDGKISKEDIDLYESLPEDKKMELMTILVPDFDEAQFKPYHLTKILKWYKEISKALAIFSEENKDPYETNESENSENS